MNDAASRRVSSGAAWFVAVLAFAVLLAPAIHALRAPLTFDDAFMFWRYALNVRDGLGPAWNPEGIPTYGLTSQLWLLVILPFTWTSLPPDLALQSASLATGLLGLATVTWLAGQGRNVRARRIALILVLLLLAAGPFRHHLTTGMDTMLSFLANALLAGAVLAWRNGHARAPVLVGFAAFAAILARPDNLIVALGIPALAWMLVLPERRWRDAVCALGIPVVLIGLFLGVCQYLYGTALPLSFYAKSSPAYDGFMSRENPVRYLADALPAALPSIVLLAFARKDWRLVVVFTIPLALTVLYFFDVRQVMGFAGRYYMPYLPFLMMPAAVMASRMGSDWRAFLKPLVVLAACLLVVRLAQPLVDRAQSAWLDATLPAPVAQPRLPIAGERELPRLSSADNWEMVATRIARHLPAGTILAATEVGKISAYGPHVTIIDMAGLNDTEIGLKGFSAGRVLARAPDIIWMPHDIYTGARSTLLRDPGFRANYRLIAGAGNFGIAIGKGSEKRAAIEKVVAHAWRRTYPGYAMDDYIVHWDEEAEASPKS